MAKCHPDRKHEANGLCRPCYQTKWDKKHPRSARKRCRKYSISASGRIHRWLRNAKYRAKKRGIPFNITISDIPIPKLCPVLGIPLKSGGRGTDDSPSIDRIIPSKGYVPGNVVIISGLANRIKTNATLVQIEKVAKWLKGVLENASH